MNYVLDASVAVKWYIDELDSDKAEHVLKDILGGQNDNKYFVPELFFFEVYSVCAKRHSKFIDVASAISAQLIKLPLHRAPMSAQLFEHATTFVVSGLTGYDSMYLGLAKLVGGRWLTFDRQAVKKVQDPKLCKLL